MDPSGLVIKISAKTKTKLWRSRLGFPTSEEQHEDEKLIKRTESSPVLRSAVITSTIRHSCSKSSRLPANQLPTEPLPAFITTQSRVLLKPTDEVPEEPMP